MCYSKVENIIQTSRKKYSDVENYMGSINEIKTKEYSDVEYREIMPEKRDFSLVAKVSFGLSASLLVIAFVSIFYSLFASVSYNNSNMYDTTNLSTEQDSEEEINIENDTGIALYLEECFACIKKANTYIVAKILFNRDEEDFSSKDYILDYGSLKNEVLENCVSKVKVLFLNNVSSNYFVDIDKYKSGVFTG